MGWVVEIPVPPDGSIPMDMPIPPLDTGGETNRAPRGPNKHNDGATSEEEAGR